MWSYLTRLEGPIGLELRLVFGSRNDSISIGPIKVELAAR
jgi:hypothetical protein